MERVSLKEKSRSEIWRGDVSLEDNGGIVEYIHGGNASASRAEKILIFRMLLPRGKKELGRPEVGPGFYPPVMHRLSLPEDPERWGVDPSYSMAHSAEAMAKMKGIERGKKYNLMAQAIPVYGFGILLYILYIIYKLTCKGTATPPVNTPVTKANMENKIPPDHDLVKLQERLRRTEMMMERIVSGKSHGSGSGRRRKSKGSTSKKEEKLLKQLRQITQLIQENRLEAASPEMEAEEVPYCVDWEGYPEETYPEYDEPYKRRGFDIFTLEEPPKQPTAEALAERMEQEEEEIMARKLSIVQEVDEDVEEEEAEEEEEEDDEDKEDEVEEETEEEEEEEEEKAEKRQLLSLSLSQPAAEQKQERLGLELSKELQCLNGAKKQISFSDRKDVFHYPKEETYEEEEEEKEDEVEEENEGTEVEEEDEGTEVEEEEEADEDDPVMEAESMLFSCEGCPNPEEEAEEDKEEYLSAPAEDDGSIHVDMPKEVGASGLRMRNRRET